MFFVFFQKNGKKIIKENNFIKYKRLHIFLKINEKAFIIFLFFLTWYNIEKLKRRGRKLS